MSEVRHTGIDETSLRKGHEYVTVAQALGELDRANRRSLSWAMLTHHVAWTDRHIQAMHSLQRTNLQSARAWRLKGSLAQVYETAAQRSRLELFKRLARTRQDAL